MQQAQGVNSFTERGQAGQAKGDKPAFLPYTQRNTDPSRVGAGLAPALGVSVFSVHSLLPPPTDSYVILQRADETGAVLRMLAEAQTSTVLLTGDAGAGKSILAALVVRQVQSGASPFQSFAWLSLGPNATLPDCLAALLSSLNAGMLPPDFMLLKPDQQIALFLQAVSNPQASAFVVLDQFEELLEVGVSEGAINRAPTGSWKGTISLFLEMLQQNLGNSRVLLTSYRSPYTAQNNEGTRIRVYMVSRISLPEGVALLQQRGVQGSSQELSLVWQRCAGHVYALVLFSALFTLSGFSLSYLLNAPDYSFMWNGDVTLNLISLVYNFLNPIQRTLLRALCLFSEPVPLEGILAAIIGNGPAIDAQAFERELAALTRVSLIQQMPPDERRHDKSSPYRPHYLLHTCIRQHTIEHYLEGHDRRPGGNLISALGVAFEPNPMAGNPEAREIALAAGHTRVTSYYFSEVQQHCPPPGQRKNMQDVEPLLALISHLCLGWHWQQACDLFFNQGLHESLISWGAWNTLIRLYTAMIPPAGVVTRRDEALICSHLGLIYGRLEDYEQSAHYYAQALETQREIFDVQGQAVTLINQGEIFRRAGEKQQARANFEEALLLLKQQPEARLESVLLHNMGLLAQDEKEYDTALTCYVESLKLARRFQEQYNQGMILTNLGMLFFEQGRLREALALFLSAVQVRQSVQDPTVNALVLFLETLEQKMGPERFAQLIQEAQGKQEQMVAEMGC